MTLCTIIRLLNDDETMGFYHLRPPRWSPTQYARVVAIYLYTVEYTTWKRPITNCCHSSNAPLSSLYITAKYPIQITTAICSVRQCHSQLWGDVTLSPPQIIIFWLILCLIKIKSWGCRKQTIFKGSDLGNILHPLLVLCVCVPWTL